MGERTTIDTVSTILKILKLQDLKGLCKWLLRFIAQLHIQNPKVWCQPRITSALSRIILNLSIQFANPCYNKYIFLENFHSRTFMALSQHLNSYLEILLNYVLLIRQKKDILGVGGISTYCAPVIVLDCLHVLFQVVLIIVFSFFNEWKVNIHLLACEIFANIFDLKNICFWT